MFDRSDSIRLWLRLLACANLIEGRLRARLAAEFETTMPRFDALAQLARAPEGMTMTRLSERMMVTKGNISGLVERLAAEGLVERFAVPGDRRASNIRLSSAGAARFAVMAPAVEAWVIELMAGLEPDQQEGLYLLLGRLRAAVTATGSEAEGRDDG